MPANLEGNTNSGKMENIGWASADYISPISNDEKNGCQKSWYKIHGILLDTKSVMEHAALKDEKWKAALASCVKLY